MLKKIFKHKVAWDPFYLIHFKDKILVILPLETEGLPFGYNYFDSCFRYSHVSAPHEVYITNGHMSHFDFGGKNVHACKLQGKVGERTSSRTLSWLRYFVCLGYKSILFDEIFNLNLHQNVISNPEGSLQERSVKDIPENSQNKLYSIFQNS